jgi:hypothetical protein
MRVTACVSVCECSCLHAVNFRFLYLLLNYFYGALLSVLDCTFTVNFAELA